MKRVQDILKRFKLDSVSSYDEQLKLSKELGIKVIGYLSFGDYLEFKDIIFKEKIWEVMFLINNDRATLLRDISIYNIGIDWEVLVNTPSKTLEVLLKDLKSKSFSMKEWGIDNGSLYKGFLVEETLYKDEDDAFKKLYGVALEEWLRLTKEVKEWLRFPSKRDIEISKQIVIEHDSYDGYDYDLNVGPFTLKVGDYSNWVIPDEELGRPQIEGEELSDFIVTEWLEEYSSNLRWARGYIIEDDMLDTYHSIVLIDVNKGRRLKEYELEAKGLSLIDTYEKWKKQKEFEEWE